MYHDTSKHLGNKKPSDRLLNLSPRITNELDIRTMHYIRWDSMGLLPCSPLPFTYISFESLYCYPHTLSIMLMGPQKLYTIFFWPNKRLVYIPPHEKQIIFLRKSITCIVWCLVWPPMYLFNNLWYQSFNIQNLINLNIYVHLTDEILVWNW